MTTTTDRTQYREAVAAIAATAHAKLPACNGRIDSAVKMVLAGDVELLPQGGARVASRTDATVLYHLANGACDCRDYARAPANLCAHRLAYGIARRVSELLPPVIEGTAAPVPGPQGAPAAPLYEAPASVNVKVQVAGREFQITLRDADEDRLLARLERVLARYPLPAPPPAATAAVPRCPEHGVMRQAKKGKGFFCPRKLGDGSFCEERAPSGAQ